MANFHHCRGVGAQSREKTSDIPASSSCWWTLENYHLSAASEFETGGSDYRVLALRPNFNMSAGPASAFMYESSKGALDGLKCNMQEGDARCGLFISLQSRCTLLDYSILAPVYCYCFSSGNKKLPF